MSASKGSQRALDLLRVLPRLTSLNLYKYPNKKKERSRGHHGGKTHGCGQKGQNQRQGWSRLGFEGGQTPYYLRVPYEYYYRQHHVRREYPPLSLRQLQLMIDTNRIDPTQPIDLTTICNTKLYKLDTEATKEFGVQLTIDGADMFKSKVNIEVQWAPEAAIAAIEKNGGTITTAYYDIGAVRTLADPLKFFRKGVPIPRRLLPPINAVKYYTDPQFRGYLADPEKIAEERFKLAQKFGYTLPDVDSDPIREMLLRRKDPRQIFFGLEPGWIVNLKDEVILKPKGKQWEEFYHS